MCGVQLLTLFPVVPPAIPVRCATAGPGVDAAPAPKLPMSSPSGPPATERSLPPAELAGGSFLILHVQQNQEL